MAKRKASNKSAGRTRQKTMTADELASVNAVAAELEAIRTLERSARDRARAVWEEIRKKHRLPKEGWFTYDPQTGEMAQNSER